jgi:hypothetical protein
MTKDLTIHLVDRPGTLANIGEAMGKKGINIEGLCGFSSEGRGVFHILVEDAIAARRCLELLKIEVQDEYEVLLITLEDKPGEFGKLCRKIANAGVNINLCYLASKTRLVLGVDNLEKAKTALK